MHVGAQGKQGRQHTLESTLELGAQQCTQEHVLLTCGQCVANVLLEYMIELGAPHTHTHTHRLNE